METVTRKEAEATLKLSNWITEVKSSPVKIILFPFLTDVEVGSLPSFSWSYSHVCTDPSKPEQ